MKFVLAQSHRYWWPITVQVPAEGLDAAGTFSEQELRLMFEPQPLDALRTAQEASGQLADPIERLEHEIAQLAAVIHDWDGVVDEAGKPVAFAPDLLRRALESAWLRRAVFDGYVQSLSGEAARRGN